MVNRSKVDAPSLVADLAVYRGCTLAIGRASLRAAVHIHELEPLGPTLETYIGH